MKACIQRVNTRRVKERRKAKIKGREKERRKVKIKAKRKVRKRSQLPGGAATIGKDTGQDLDPGTNQSIREAYRRGLQDPPSNQLRGNEKRTAKPRSCTFTTRKVSMKRITPVHLGQSFPRLVSVLRQGREERHTNNADDGSQGRSAQARQQPLPSPTWMFTPTTNYNCLFDIAQLQ